MENFWIEISKHFHRFNRRCFLIFPKLDALSPSLQKSFITIIQHDFSDRSRSSRKRLKRIIKTNSISGIYLTDRRFFDSYYLLLRIWGIRSIILHDHTPGERNRQPFYRRILKRTIHLLRIFSCDLYIGVSKFVYDRFLENGCVPRRKCCYVLNGIIPIQKNEKNIFYIHNQLGLPECAINVVTTGRATFYKGVDFIIKCANELINGLNEKRVFFVHCGDGPDLKQFKKMAYDFKLEQRFFFLGKRPDVINILQSCHIGIQASLGEAFSLSILEYMSAGLATVVPDHCGNNEAVTHGETGMLYRPEDIEQAVQLLAELVNNVKLRNKLGSNAMKTVKERFDIRRTNKELIECVKDRL